MKNIYIKGDCMSILNEAIDTTMFFSKNDQDFVVVDWDEEPADDYVELPYSIEIENAYMRYFLKSKGKEAFYRVDQNWFFRFAESNGWLREYLDGEEAFLYSYMNLWAKENDIALNWNTLEIV